MTERGTPQPDTMIVQPSLSQYSQHQFALNTLGFQSFPLLQDNLPASNPTGIGVQLPSELQYMQQLARGSQPFLIQRSNPQAMLSPSGMGEPQHFAVQCTQQQLQDMQSSSLPRSSQPGMDTTGFAGQQPNIAAASDVPFLPRDLSFLIVNAYEHIDSEIDALSDTLGPS
jgi:hypothetical protein